MAELIEYPTGKRIIDNGKCDNCKWNCGYKSKDYNIIWCDLYLGDRNRYYSCKKYIFRLNKE